ncbi:MAG: hypothetical protein Q4E67_03415 [Planctomycetia bacterium]|nr:hypothetical protein [Planctomycetia bacterium]
MRSKILQGGFVPEISESGLLADVADSFGLNLHVTTVFGGRVGLFADEFVLALPICNVEAGCCWPFSIRLVGWYVTRDGDFWFTVPAVGGGDKRGSIGTWNRLLSPDCRRVNIFSNLHDLLTAGAIANDDGNFCFLRKPDIVDFHFLMALDGRECRIVFPPFQGNLGWARQWLRYTKEAGQAKAIPLQQVTLLESLEKREVAI